MGKDVVMNFIKIRIEENIDIFSSKNKYDLIKKTYLLGLKDGIDLITQQ